MINATNEKRSKMNKKTFKYLQSLVAIGFSLVFCFVVIPPLLANPDIIGAFAAGFVNPYATGYSLDVFFCWAALAILVIYDAKVLSVKYGWACLLLGIVPGVAVGLSLYFILRTNQLIQKPLSTESSSTYP